MVPIKPDMPARLSGLDRGLKRTALGFLASGKRAVVLTSLVAIGACSFAVSGGGCGGASGATGGTGGTAGTGGTGATGGAGGMGGIDFGPPPPVSAAIPTSPSAINFSLVAGDNAHLLTWCEPTLDGFRVVAQRLAADGQPIDATPIEVTTFAGELCDTAAAHAPGGPFLVAWLRDSPGNTVEAVRVSAELEILDAPIFVAAGDMTNNGVVWSELWKVGASGVDGAYLVWYQKVDDTDSEHIYQQRVTTDGVLSSTPEQLGDWHPPFALQVGDDVLQLWTEYTPSFNRVSARVGDAPPVHLSTPDHFGGDAVAAFDGDRALVVWNENDGPSGFSNGKTIKATFLDPSSPGIGQPFQIPEAEYGGSRAVVGFVGDHYLVVMQHQGGRLHGVRVALDGTQLDPEGFVIADEGRLVGERLAVRDGVALVLYSVFGPTPSSERVTYLRAIGELGP